MSKINLEFQHFHGCPNGPTFLKRLQEAIGLCSQDVELTEVVIDTPIMAGEYSFRGSPTLLVNGEDFEGLQPPENPLLSCRLYPDGLPTVETIVERLDSIT